MILTTGTTSSIEESLFEMGWVDFSTCLPADATPSLLLSGSQGDGPLSVGLLAGIAAGSLAVCILCGVALMRCQSVRYCCSGWCGSSRMSSRIKSSYIQFTNFDSRIEASAL